MTRKETVKLFAAIAALYPRDNAFSDSVGETVALWHSMLEDVPAELAVEALKMHASTSQWPPSIAQIKQCGLRLTTNQIPSDEAWGLALKAIQKGGIYRPEKAKEIAGPEVWALMERMGYRDLCMTESVDVLRGQFTRLWDARQKRQMENALLPPSVRAMTLQLALPRDCQ